MTMKIWLRLDGLELLRHLRKTPVPMGLKGGIVRFEKYLPELRVRV